MIIQPGNTDFLIETQRLILRRVTPQDEPLLCDIFCDATMMHYLGSPWDRSAMLKTLVEWRQDWGVENRWMGVMVRTDTQQGIGVAGLTCDTIQDERGYELSWFILPAHQRQGFAAEITTALVNLAFERFNAQRVIAETHPQNPAANALLGKLGFNCLGERHHTYDFLPGFDVQVLWERLRI